MKKNQISGAAALWKSLMEEGVDTVFGYPGGQIMPVYDSLCDFEQDIRHILVRHEQGAVHAAQGYARIKGQPGVVIVTSGPGATNVVTGIVDALTDSTPLVAGAWTRALKDESTPASSALLIADKLADSLILFFYSSDLHFSLLIFLLIFFEIAFCPLFKRGSL